MRKISLSSLGTEEIQIGDIVVFQQKWVTGRSFSYLERPRPDNGLLLVQSGCARERLPDHSFFCSKPGDLLSLPIGSHYRAEFIADSGETEEILVNFRLFDRNGEEIKISAEPEILLRGVGPRLADLFLEAVHAFSLARGKLQLQSCLYAIFGELAAQVQRDADEADFALIRPGVEYLENHIPEKIPVAELAALCGVSESTFRRIFQRYAGVSPIEYRDRIRISLAKQLLSTRELSVQEISSRLGFYDSAYFCRVFLQKTGKRPSAYF